MNFQLPLLRCANTCVLLACSPVFRRQQFLIRSLGSGIDHYSHFSSGKMQDLKSVEVDAESIIRAITPALDSGRHKGQAGTHFFQAHLILFLKIIIRSMEKYILSFCYG